MTEPLFPRPIAHRGLHDRAKGVIENSASAFEAAIAGNFAIECDVQLTSDGVPVIFHDDVLERLTGKDGAVADLTVAEMTSHRRCSTAPPATARSASPISSPRSPAAPCCRSSSSSSATWPAPQLLARAAAEALKSYAGPVTVESFDPNLLTAGAPVRLHRPARHHHL